MRPPKSVRLTRLGQKQTQLLLLEEGYQLLLFSPSTIQHPFFTYCHKHLLIHEDPLITWTLVLVWLIMHEENPLLKVVQGWRICNCLFWFCLRRGLACTGLALNLMCSWGWTWTCKSPAFASQGHQLCITTTGFLQCWDQIENITCARHPKS